MNPLSFADKASLVTAIQGMIEDTGAELTANIDTLIKLGEARCYTDLNLEIQDTVITPNLTAATRLQAIKTATNQALRAVLIRDAGGTGQLRRLSRRSLDFCMAYAPDPSVQAEPVYYAEYSPTELYMVPTPNAAYQATLRYVGKPPSLVDGATWLAANYGDLLLYSCLISTEQFLKADDSFINGWKTTYGETLAIRRFEARDMIRADYAPVQNAARSAEDRP